MAGDHGGKLCAAAFRYGDIAESEIRRFFGGRLSDGKEATTKMKGKIGT